MAKYLKICPFISAKALKCVILLGKTIKIYHWAFPGGGVGGLACEAWLWGGWVTADCMCSFGGGSAAWTLAPHFGSRLHLFGSLELGCRGPLWLSLTCQHGLLMLVWSIPRPGCAMAAC